MEEINEELKRDDAIYTQEGTGNEAIFITAEWAVTYSLNVGNGACIQ